MVTIGLFVEVFEESFEGIDFAADAFGSVALGAEVGNVLLEMGSLDRGSLGNAPVFEVEAQLIEVALVSDGGAG